MLACVCVCVCVRMCAYVCVYLCVYVCVYVCVASAGLPVLLVPGRQLCTACQTGSALPA